MCSSFELSTEPSATAMDLSKSATVDFSKKRFHGFNVKPTFFFSKWRGRNQSGSKPRTQRMVWWSCLSAIKSNTTSPAFDAIDHETNDIILSLQAECDILRNEYHELLERDALGRQNIAELSQTSRCSATIQSRIAAIFGLLPRTTNIKCYGTCNASEYYCQSGLLPLRC
jgi:hypothetical protein